MSWFKRKKGTYATPSVIIKYFSIEYMPTEHTYDEMPVYKKSITDEELVIDNTRPKDISYIMGCIQLALGIGVGYQFGNILISEPFDIIFFFLLIPTPLFLFIMGIKFIYRPIRKFTFHRMTGLVDVPKRGFKGWNGATNAVPFELLDIGWGHARTHSLSVTYPGSPWMFLPVLFESFDRCNTTAEEVIDGFLAWYMDKNRPLPPGKALDPYRMKDYLRREAEGFPEPIYRAARGIKIPDRKKMPIIKEEQEIRTKQNKEEI